MLYKNIAIENDKKILGRCDFPIVHSSINSEIEECFVGFTEDDKVCLFAKKKGEKEKVLSFFDGHEKFLCDDSNPNYLTIHSVHFGSMRFFYSDGDLCRIEDKLSFDEFNQSVFHSKVEQASVDFGEMKKKLNGLGIKVIVNDDDSIQLVCKNHKSAKIYGVSSSDTIAAYGKYVYLIGSENAKGQKSMFRINIAPEEDVFDMTLPSYIEPIKFDKVFSDKAVLLVDVKGFKSKILVDSRMNVLSHRSKNISGITNMDNKFDMIFTVDDEDFVLTTKNVLQGEEESASFKLSRVYSLPKSDDISQMVPSGVEVKEYDNILEGKHCSFVRNDGYKVGLFQCLDSKTKTLNLAVEVTSPEFKLKTIGDRDGSHVLEPVGLFSLLDSQTTKIKNVFGELKLEHYFPDIKPNKQMNRN